MSPLNEILGKRTWNAKHFDVGGGLNQAQIGVGHRHYLKADGTWDDINMEFRLENGAYVMDQSAFACSVPLASDGWASFIANIRWDIFEDIPITDAPLTMQMRAVGVG